MTEISSLVASQDNDDHHCLICYNELDFKTLLPCNHNSFCPVCVLRMRHLHNDKKCPICKQEHEQVICEETSKQEHESFSEYPIWGNELGEEYIYRETVGMFFRTEYYHREIQPLLSYPCMYCKEFDGVTAAAADGKKTAQRLLQDHLRTKHRLQLCQLCVDHQRDFVSQLPLFTPTQIQVHLKQGDKGTAFNGHPICEFCKPKRFYDMTQLHMHLNQEHYKCHVCDKAGIPNQFFKNYKSLERHFDNKHFLCHHPQCLQARFVVFESELDLRHHERQVHGTTTGSSKISLEFQYGGRRNNNSDVGPQDVPSASDFDYSLDGQAFVPDDLPQSSASIEADDVADPSTLHPLHLQRTAQLRQQAARVAQEQGLTPSQPEAFPSLAAATEAEPEAAPSLRAGWSNGSTISRVAAKSNKKAVGKVTKESFPALGGGGSSSSSSNNPTKRPARVGSNSTLAAIRQASNPTPAPSWGTQRANVPTGTSSSSSSSMGLSQKKKAGPGIVPRAAAPNMTSSEQFPSLGGGSSSGGRAPPQAYAAANALARQPPAATQQQPYAAANTLARQQKKAPQTAKVSTPDLKNASHFPPPPQSSNNASSVRNRILGNNAPTQAASANVLQAPSARANSKSSDPQTTVEDLKATLGKQKYKELKRLTGEFANDSLTGDAYVDMVAALFEHGYGDADFWSAVPSLIESCPASPSERAKALTYMDHLKRMKNGAMNAESSTSTSKPTTTATTNNWSAQPSIPAAPPPSSSSSGSWPAPVAQKNAPIKKAPPKTNYILPKKKGAWGANGSGASSAVVAKARPGSVAVAAANARQPQQKTGTKFMAQEQKKAFAANNGKNGNKKKKGKQNNELKQLAFGL
mmetsp:Transcript_11584/g.32073  ORF Transcript_11584/g.32073 Transcript_11584/m.32073 type:complete len:862 (-) Transcript_11584:68-2653(-)